MFGEFLEKNKISDKVIAVGVSGGSDSLGLALMLEEELADQGYKIIALTVDHQLRLNSSQEAVYVKTIMQNHGIEHHTLVWTQTPKPVSDIENMARKARYGLIAEWCKAHGVKYVMTAHHLFDQAETFFLRLQRGSGLNGLCGMREVFCWHGLYILRPLLETNPDIMKKYLQSKNISWVEDESNRSEEYLRVKIRHTLPILYQKIGLTPEQIVNTMRRLQYSRDYLENETRQFLQNSFKNWFDHAYSCEYTCFLNYSEEIQFRTMSYLLRQIGQTEYAPRAQKILGLIKQIKEQNFHAATLGGCYICRFNNALWFFPEEYEKGNYTVAVWKSLQQMHPDLCKLKLPFRLRVYIVNHK